MHPPEGPAIVKQMKELDFNPKLVHFVRAPEGAGFGPDWDFTGNAAMAVLQEEIVMRMNGVTRRNVLRLACGSALSMRGARAQSKRGGLYAVPNFHPGCMGWLAPYHVERNYCIYGYLHHVDAAARDPEYRFAFSEIPHLITMMEFEPERVAQFRKMAAKGQIEMVNAFVLEPTINLSGGEALVMQGLEGLRWYSQIMRTRPRHCWMIDITGWHEQMAQIVNGLGLDSFVYCRYNPLAKTTDPSGAIDPHSPAVHWLESPDGTRTLAVNPGHYSGALDDLLETGRALPAGQTVEILDKLFEQQAQRHPDGAPLLALAGTADYSLSFKYAGYPAEMLAAWRAARPDQPFRIATLSDWVDEFRKDLETRMFDLPTVRSGSAIYGWTAFWVNAPEMKQWYRRAEHHLQAGEALATAASLLGNVRYPTQALSNSWFLMALNMDRALLWGVAVNGVWKHDKVWDTCDRFTYVDQTSSTAEAAAWTRFGKPGSAVSLFNPVSWKRVGLIEIPAQPGKTLQGAQLLEDGETILVRASLPAMGVASLPTQEGTPPSGAAVALPEFIENQFYRARIDPATGALASLTLKPSGREVLAGPANVVLAQVRDPKLKHDDPAHEIPLHDARVTVMSSSGARPSIRCTAGPLATIVEITGPFRGGPLRRVIRFYKDSPRIDFVVETNDVPDGTIVTAEFPLAGSIAEVRRGIPYGFAHAPWASPNPSLHGLNAGVVPVIRWADYALQDGGGVAMLDRGVPSRELAGNKLIVLLNNVFNRYYWDASDWTNGKGRRRFQYAIYAHETPWAQARVPHMAWEYNAPPLVSLGTAVNAEQSFLETSPNLIVEALRRTGKEIEVRLVECLGGAGPATVKVNLPHLSAALTDLIGGRRRPLKASSRTSAGAKYIFDVRRQQIVTLRLAAQSEVAPVEALTTFDSVVPPAKRAATRGFKHPDLKGHPPTKGVPEWKSREGA